ncbi:MAG: hypothetical protein ABI559_00075 [Chloroflexota bacterium]
MSSFSRGLYRLRQLRRTLRPHVQPEERADARRVLGERLYPLFDSMQAADQRHCLDVYARLVANGCADSEMLQAALIHDAGKGSIAGARFGVQHRVAYVVLERTPGLLKRAARYNRGLASLQAHDRKTLELAREYGATDGIIALLREMGSPTSDRARLLKSVDDES